MSQFSEFFLNSDADIVKLDTIEISHPNFSQVYRVVRNSFAGLDAKLEDGSDAHFDYYPLQITPTKSSDDLDQVLKIQFGDLGEILPTELDAVYQAGGFTTKPTIIYRQYRSDDLSAPMDGPYRFEGTSLAFDSTGPVLEAAAPRLNQSATGETYIFSRFPMLRGIH